MRFLAVLALVLTGSLIPARAVETEVVFDGSGVDGWTSSREPERQAREFYRNELTTSAPSPSKPLSLLWNFTVRDAAFNDIFLGHAIARRFAAIRIYIQNEGAAFDLACKVRARDGAEWTAQRVPLPAGDAWRWVEFPAAGWQPASWSHDADGQLDFPLEFLALIAFNVKSGADYRIHIGSIEIARPDAPVADLREFHLPAQIQAGQRIPVQVRFAVDRPVLEADAPALAFLREGAESFRLPLPLAVPLKSVEPGQEVSLQTELEMPLYTYGGPHTVALRLGEAHIRYQGAQADGSVAQVAIIQRATADCVAKVQMHHGTPTLFLNGRPHCGMTWATYRPSPGVFRDFTQAGIDLFTFAATPTESGYNLSRTAWTAPDVYDFSQLDERALMVLKENPDAFFFPRLYLHAPKWWSEQHPGDLVLMDPGDGKFVPFLHSGGKPAPSWASETWRQDTIAGLRKLIAHVEASPYADRVIGYHLASGTTEEWMMWGGNEQQWVDFSPVNTRRFRDWLRSKYESDAALRSAWGDPAVSLDSASIPSKAQRQHSGLGILRDPAREQSVIDFYLYNSDLVAGTICTFAKAVKDLTGRKKLVGAFYGYLLQLCGEHRQQNAGHLALQQVLDCPDLDFLTSPTSYAFRQVGGEGTSHFMSLFGSVKLHGKLWFDENDIRTSLAPGKLGTWGKPSGLAGDLLQQDKELANVIVHGSAQWWFDVGANVYSHPTLMTRIAALTRHAGEALEMDRSAVDEVALLVDERSLCHLRVADPMGARLLLTQLPALARIGAPVGHYLITDLPRLRDRKLFLFPTSFAPSAEDRAAIESLKRDGHVLVFLYAPGLYREGKLDESGMADLTGIHLRLSREESSFQVSVADGHPLTRELAGQTIGDERRGFPVCYADDPEAEILGRLPDGKPGLVMKRGKDWTSVFSAVPLLPTPLLRQLAQAAGVHLYASTEDVVWASHDLLAVCVKDGGPRSIRLPRTADVQDLYSGKTIGSGLSSFTTDFPDRSTRVFVLKSSTEPP